MALGDYSDFQYVGAWSITHMLITASKGARTLSTAPAVKNGSTFGLFSHMWAVLHHAKTWWAVVMGYTLHMGHRRLGTQ